MHHHTITMAMAMAMVAHHAMERRDGDDPTADACNRPDDSTYSLV